MKNYRAESNEDIWQLREKGFFLNFTKLKN
jgi:hypothetical protein